jgi:hypothetical protein
MLTMKHGDIGMETPRKTASEKEAEISLEGPAPFANRFYISIGVVARFAFAEQSGPEKDPHFRNAVSLSIQDAIAFANLLKALLGPLETKMAQAASDGAKADHVG